MQINAELISIATARSIVWLWYLICDSY